MREFGILYRYELKKIMQRKIVKIATVIVFALILGTVCAELSGNYYVDGKVYDTHYHMMKTDREYARKLNGRKINQDLIMEMQDAYRHIPENEREGRYSLTEEYQDWARPYSQIYQFVNMVMEKKTLSDLLAWKADENELYENLGRRIEEEREDAFLTEEEKAFWREKEEQTEKPYTFYYAEGYWKLLYSSYGICYVLLLYAAVCLADLYTREHSLRTDQLLLSSRLGKRQLYWAKALAGMSFAGMASLILIALVMFEVLFIYGTDGFQMALQYAGAFFYYSEPVSVGTTVIIVYALILAAVLVTGAFVVMLSELLQNGTAVLAVVFGMVSVTMFFNIPPQMRLASQLYAYLPGKLLSLNMGGAFSLRLVRVFGRYLTTWQFVPLLYLLSGAAFLLIGKWAYGRYQVSGR